MTISRRNEFSTNLAKTVLDDIQYQRSRYYYFLGRVNPWAGTDVDPAASIPKTQEQDNIIRQEILYTKLIAPSEASLVTRRIDWETGTVYDQWDHTQDMTIKNFYVMTDSYRVYKCLDNANGAASTVKPASISLDTFRTSDGYLWKYMYTIPAFKRDKFLTATNMPVQNALSDNFYNNGQVDDVVVVYSGSGYANTPVTYITVDDTGATTGSGALATPVIGALGAITSITVDNGGTGYTKGATVTIIGNGSGAKAEAVISGGVITGFTITNPGVAYDEFTSVLITVGGATVVPKINGTTGEIVGTIITNPGSGYNTAPTLTVATAVGYGGSGVYGNPTAVITPIVYDGKLVRANVTDPGSGYSVDTATTISVTGSGTGASFTPVIDNGKIIGVVVNNRGTGYTNVTLTVNSTTGSGAVLQGVITPSDYQSDQNVIEQTSVKGAIYTIKVTASGANYASNSTVSIVGNGTGCTATPVVTAGTITAIEVTNPGSGYTYATVVITDPSRPDELIPSEQKASAYAIMSPYGGHGTNAIQELYADKISITSFVRSEIESLNITQDFRTFGILKNPKSLLTNIEYSALQSLAVYKMNINSITGLVKDEILLFSNNRYRVVDFGGSSVYLMPLDRDNLVPIGTLTSQADSLRQYQTIESTYNIDFNKYSGELLYVTTETPFTFGDEQSLVLKTVIKF